jgi:hypothetical protein
MQSVAASPHCTLYRVQTCAVPTLTHARVREARESRLPQSVHDDVRIPRKSVVLPFPATLVVRPLHGCTCTFAAVAKRTINARARSSFLVGTVTQRSSHQCGTVTVRNTGNSHCAAQPSYSLHFESKVIVVRFIRSALLEDVGGASTQTAYVAWRREPFQSERNSSIN